MDYVKVTRKGSYFVGGEKVTIEGTNPIQMELWPGGPMLNYDPNGDFQAGQMYVQYTRLADPVVPYPVCMVHGGGGTGALWETTQAGEPGWEYMFLQNGFHVNVSDGVERGRASWAQFPEINPVPPASTATLNVGLPTGSVPNTRRAMQEAASMPVNTTPL